MGVTVSQEADQLDNVPTTGYHVLRVRENSPAALCGIEPYFDYIVAAGGIRLDEQNLMLLEILKNNRDQELLLVLYNAKTQDFRESVIVPTDKWEGEGLLGCSIRFCNFKLAAEHVWHVMEVYPNSPASHAGLRPHHDYIIGTPEVIIKDKNDLFLLVDQHIGKALRFYVYNWETDKTREVAIIPDPNWGGDGALGCDIGFGYLHRIPRVKAPVLNNADGGVKVDYSAATQPIALTDLGRLQANLIKKVSDSSLMTASDSITSLPDMLSNDQNRNSANAAKNVGKLEFEGVDLKAAKSRNTSKVALH